MVIDIEGKREGVVGVTGNPEEIRPIALIIKMAIETLIKYENQKMQAFRRQTRKDRFMEMLTQKQYRAPQDIQKLASELNYSCLLYTSTYNPSICAARSKNSIRLFPAARYSL